MKSNETEFAREPVSPAGGDGGRTLQQKRQAAIDKYRSKALAEGSPESSVLAIVRADLLEIEGRIKLNFDSIVQIEAEPIERKMGMQAAALDLFLRVCRQDQRYAQLELRWLEHQKASSRSTKTTDSARREPANDDRQE